MASKARAARARKPAGPPRQPSDPFGPFDPNENGCPLVALAKTCAEMRAGHCCPRWQAFKRIDGAGQMVGMDWACAHKWTIDLLAELNGRTLSVQAAIEKRGDRAADLLHTLNANQERLIGTQAKMGEVLTKIAEAPPLDLSALDAPTLTTPIALPGGAKLTKPNAATREPVNVKDDKIEQGPRQPDDGSAVFDPIKYGCPLVNLDKTCAEMRTKNYCPMYRQFRRSDASGAIIKVFWACSYFSMLDGFSELAGYVIHGFKQLIEAAHRGPPAEES